jgi:hypothetical protein
LNTIEKQKKKETGLNATFLRVANEELLADVEKDKILKKEGEYYLVDWGT